MPPTIGIRNTASVSRCATRPTHRGLEVLLCLSMMVVGGCQTFSNPYHDDLADRQAVTTASVEGVHAATIAQRAVAPPRGNVKVVAPKDGTVTHGPLYFEDPSEESGSEDGHFSWTHEDFAQIVTWRARFLVNVLLLPVSAVMTPPSQTMASDGRPSREVFGMIYDADRWEGK